MLKLLRASLPTSLTASLALLGSVYLPAATADELSDASLALCEKVKSCVVAEMGDQMSPQIRAMIQPTLDQMCETLKAQVTAVPPDHEQYQPAVTCLQSMTRLSCATMTSGEDFITPQCRQYEEQGKQAFGIE
jgi:hypothetical protein